MSKCPVSDDGYLIKLKSLGIPDKQIAAKLGLSLGEVERKWDQLVRETACRTANGYIELCEKFNNMALQYQILGDSLKIVGGMLGEIMREDEIRALITSHPEDTLKNLLMKAIVLRPFVSPDEKPKTPTPPPDPIRN